MLYFPLTNKRVGVSCKILDLSVLDSKEVSIPFCELDLGKHMPVTLYSCPACAKCAVFPPLEAP